MSTLAKLKMDPNWLGLVGPFTAIARAMSQQWSVQIVPNGFECKTDGKRIWIPFAADHLPEDARQILHGMLDHEVCHVVEEGVHADAGRATPLDLFKMEKNRTIVWMLNVVEDIRIELKWSVRYPGVAENLNVLHKHMTDIAKADPKKLKAASFWHRFGCAFICAARGFEMLDYGDDVTKALEECAAELEESKHLSWAQESYDLAERIYKKLRREHEETLEKAEAVKGKGKRGEGESVPGDGEPIPSDEGEGEEAPPTPEEIESAKKFLADMAEIADPTKLVAAKIEEAARKDCKDHRLYVPDPELRKLDVWKKPDGGDMANYLAAREEVQSQIGAIRGRQLAFIQTITRKRLASGRDSGDLDGTRLADIRTGSVDIFTETKKGRVLDTAIEVLIDLSGSMGSGDHRECAAYYAKRTAICLVEAWEPLRIPNEFMGFTNSYSRSAPGAPDPDTVRRSPFDFTIFKAWGEPLKACRERFSTIQGYSDNADGEAVQAAACRLAARPEKRKILVVISDGRPACGSIGFDMLEDHLRQTVKRITRAGIEVLGVGAGTDAPASFYNKSTGATNMVIRDVSQLAVTLFAAMRERILG